MHVYIGIVGRIILEKEMKYFGRKTVLNDWFYFEETKIFWKKKTKQSLLEFHAPLPLESPYPKGCHQCHVDILLNIIVRKTSKIYGLVTDYHHWDVKVSSKQTSYYNTIGVNDQKHLKSQRGILDENINFRNQMITLSLHSPGKRKRTKKERNITERLFITIQLKKAKTVDYIIKKIHDLIEKLAELEGRDWYGLSELECKWHIHN